jgi:GNAT superfamily N-acetyltransferase
MAIEPTAIRDMLESDSPIIAEAFAAQGWDKPVSLYVGYWQAHVAGRRDVLVAERGGEFAGYITVVWESDYPPFREKRIPEIADFNVLIRHRRMGVGTALMDAAEQRIALRSPVIGLGVGLYPDYGAAQVLYVRRGYVPDGRGLFTGGRHPQPGEQVRLDDDLVLHLTRRLRQE